MAPAEPHLRCMLARGTPATLPSPMNSTQNSITDTCECSLVQVHGNFQPRRSLQITFYELKTGLM